MQSQAVLSWLQRFTPHPVTVPLRERLRACIGALIGIALTGLSMHALLGADSIIPFLVAPMGASAVLLFAVPGSPLAQPWSFVGGNLVAATVGVLSARWVADPVMAAALALAVATCAMFALRCIHPPSGAVALTAVLGGPTVHALGMRFVLEPIAVQSLVLLATAIAYHKLTGHRYPHAAHARASTTGSVPTAAGITREDLETVVRKHGELIDVASDDLESVLQEAQLLAYARSFSELTCAQVMSAAPVAVTRETTAGTAWRLLERHRVKALPVVDGTHHVVGIVTRTDFVGKTAWGLRRIRTRRPFARDTVSTRRIDELMTKRVRTVDQGTAVAQLIPLFAHYGHHHIPVVDHERRLVGMITQSDLIGGLHRQTQARALRAA